MNLRPRFVKILSTVSILAAVLPLLAACGSPAAIVAQLSNQSLSICHATGSATTPYETVTLKLPELVAHANDKNDIIPAPVGGCPSTVQVGANNGQFAVCHATGNAGAPYSRIIVDVNGLLTHINHQGDIIISPSSSCPTTLVVLAATTGTVAVTPTGTMTPTLVTTSIPTLTSTPTLAITATFTATPTITGTPGTITPTAEGTENGAMITICHATGSAKNPYVMITIDVNGLNGHRHHPRDIIPAPAGGCPK